MGGRNRWIALVVLMFPGLGLIAAGLALFARRPPAAASGPISATCSRSRC